MKSGSRKYCVLKWENTQYKVENGIQSNKIFFVGLLKILAVKSSGCMAFRDTAEKEVLINVMLTMHYFVNFILTPVYSLKHITMASFHETKGRFSERKEKSLQLEEHLRHLKRDPWR